jgi:hypothetical protein
MLGPGGVNSTQLFVSASVAGTYTVTVTGTSGPVSHTTATITVVVSTRDFTIAANPTTISIAVNGTGTSTISITPIGGFSDTVSLTATVNATTGLTATLNPTSVTMSGTSTLTVTGSAAGTYLVTVTGTSGTITHNTNVTVTVGGVQVTPPSFIQSTWKQKLSLAKNNFQQTWKFGIVNNDLSTTIYAQVQVSAIDGSGSAPFTTTTAVVTLLPGQSVSNLLATQTFTRADIGASFTFQAVILWGTSPTVLDQRSTAVTSQERTSGSFIILP